MLRVENFECNLDLDKVWLTGSATDLGTPDESHFLQLQIQNEGKRETIKVTHQDVQSYSFITGETWNLDALIIEKSTLLWTRFKVVRFNPHGDGVTALYINDNLERYGDYYHDKIDEVLDGFKQGLEYANFQFSWKTYECHDDETNTEICEYADSPDNNFNNLKGLK